MGPWQNYLVVVLQDLWVLAEMLLWTGAAMLLPGVVIALAATTRFDRLRVGFLAGAVLLAWLVCTLVFLTTFLFGWGLVALLYRHWHVDMVAVPQRFWLALTFICSGIALVLGYRHTTKWLRASQTKGGTDNANEDKPARLRASFSLGTLLLYQLILLLGVGLWIECRRDWVAEQYREQAGVAEHARWVQSLEDRFGGYGWIIEHSELDDPERFLKLRLPPPMRDWQNIHSSLVDQIQLDDGLMVLHLRSDDLTDEGLRKIARHKWLQELCISSPQITDEAIVELQTLPNRYHFEFRCPRLTNRSLELFPSLRGGIWVESPLITAEAVNAHNATQQNNWVQLMNASQP